MTRSRGIRSVLALILVLLLSDLAWAEVCKGSKIPRAELREYDAHAELAPAEQVAALHTHLPWGQPACPMLLPSQGYVVCYDPLARIGIWAAYQLKAEDLISIDRRDAFRSDPRLSEAESAHCNDYAKSGYDRGHVVPNSDMGRSKAIQASTFYLSNMTPQAPALNRGMWRWLEELVRAYVKEYGSLYVITGSVVPDAAPTVHSGNVKVPARYYKVLIRTNPDGTPASVLTVLLPNLQEGLPVPPGSMGVQGQRLSSAAADAYLSGHLVSIREIEHATGLDLLSKFDAESLKRAVATEVWPRN